MPYGTQISETDRIKRHMSLYGEMPPETRLRIPQGVNTLEVSDNTNLMMLSGGIVVIYIFVEFILPRLMDK